MYLAMEIKVLAKIYHYISYCTTIIMSVNNKLAKKIKEAREKSGLSQARVGVLCGWSQSYQALIEGGRARISVA